MATNIKKESTPIKKRIMTCIDYPSANQYLPQPYKLKEKVLYLGEVKRKEGVPETFTKQFIKIMRLGTKRVEVESRKYFKFLN